jgi:hypothetical protein
MHIERPKFQDSSKDRFRIGNLDYHNPHARQHRMNKKATLEEISVKFSYAHGIW